MWDQIEELCDLSELMLWCASREYLFFLLKYNQEEASQQVGYVDFTWTKFFDVLSGYKSPALFSIIAGGEVCDLVQLLGFITRRSERETLWKINLETLDLRRI